MINDDDDTYYVRDDDDNGGDCHNKKLLSLIHTSIRRILFPYRVDPSSFFKAAFMSRFEANSTTLYESKLK